MKTRTSKILGLLLLVLMISVFTMPMAVFAADSDANMTALNYNDYNVIRGTNALSASSSTEELEAGPANSSYVFTGYDSANSAVNDVTWSIVDGSTCDVSITGAQGTAVQVSPGVYAAQITVTVAQNSPAGCASIQATRDNGQLVNFTIIVNQTDTNNEIDPEDPVEDVGVYIDDLYYYGTAPDSSPSNRSFSTPMDVMNTQNDVDITVMGGNYITSMTYDGTTKTAAGYEGWNCRVYRYDGLSNYNMVANSAVISTDSFMLQDGDIILWLYGTPEYATANFPAYI